MAKLQLAVDVGTIEEAISLINEVQDYVDIIEAGTPFIYEWGMKGVSTFSKQFSKEVVADLKIMDAGSFETNTAISYGADIVTVLAVSNDGTILDALDAAHKQNKLLVADLIDVDNVEERVRQLEKLGVDYVCVHTDIASQKNGKTPVENLKKIKDAAKNIKVAVAGGINEKTIKEITSLKPDIVIVGSFIYNDKNPKEKAKFIKEYLNY